MTYTPNPPWQDLPSTATPITAASLDHMEAGILAASGAPFPAAGRDLGSAGSTVNGTSMPLTTTDVVKAGETIKVWVYSAGGSAQAPTSVSGGALTWRNQATHSFTSGPTVSEWSAYTPSDIAAGLVITATLGSATAKKGIRAYAFQNVKDANADGVSAGNSSGSTTSLLTGTVTGTDTGNFELYTMIYALSEAQLDTDWTVPAGWTKIPNVTVGSPALTLLVAYQVAAAGSITPSATVTGAAGYTGVAIVQAGTPIPASYAVQQLAAGADGAVPISRSGVVSQIVQRPALVLLDDPKYGVKADAGTTENGALINAALASLASAGGGIAQLSGGNTAGFGIKQPLWVPSGVTLAGVGSRGGSSITAQTGFPTTTLNGALTTPASAATTFTVTVASTAGFPGGVGGPSPSDGIGVLTLGGITIHYPFSGVTGTTFTNCQTYDTSMVVANATPVSTPVIHLGGTATSGGTGNGFGARLMNLAVFCGSVAPGISGVHATHLEESGGIYNMLVDRFRNFGYRLETHPMAPTAPGNQLVNFDPLQTISWTFDPSCDANAVAMDILNQNCALNHPFDCQRGSFSFGGSVSGGGTVTCKAQIRLNGVTGTYEGFHMELTNRGFLIGDLFPSHVQIANGGFANSGFSDECIKIANTAGNQVIIEGVEKTNPSAFLTRILLNDALHSYTSTAARIDQYRINNDGTIDTTLAPKAGKVTGTPGAVTTLNIPHGQPTTPSSAIVTPGDTNSRGAPAYYVHTDATNVIVEFASALAAATAYTWNWRVS